MDRKIILLSGKLTCGKSFWAKKLLELLSSDTVYWLDGDDISVKYWPQGHVLTDEEHLFKNELLRMEIKMRFIIDHASIVIVSSVMLTAREHQAPFVRMAEDVGAEIRAILLTCNHEAVERQRIARANTTGASPIDDYSFRKCDRLFELPHHYSVLRIDTSEESIDADTERLRRILEYIV